MSPLAFTLLRIGYVALLWVFIFFVVRTLRRDVAEPGSQSHPKRLVKGRQRQPTRILITEGPLAGSVVPLSPQALTIGRSPSCTLVLEDSYASSRHARIFPKDGRWWLEDLGSTNGTLLDGQPVHGVVELPVRTPVRIGQTTVELRP